jgi:prepilin-type N-terminal cleavage/methylation domain-containing protein
METFPSRHNRIFSRGFSLIEVAISIFVLSIGLTAVASLLGRSVGDTTHSRYQASAAELASEKLEDLNRYPAYDPNVVVNSGASVGSLTADIVTNNVNSAGITEAVNYWDEVQLSSTGGSISETDTGYDTSGNPNYTTTTHSPNGTITVTTTSTAPATNTTLTFHRRWLIEKDTPVTGVKRITVYVYLISPSIHPMVSFQMSGVRP